VLEQTTIPSYAARHPIEIGHIRETFTALIHGLIALVRSQPTISDDVLAAIVRQTLRLAPSDATPSSPAHASTSNTSTLKGE